MSRNIIRIGNLECALRAAIEAARVEELQRFGPNGKSAYRAGLEEALRRSDEGEAIEIDYSP